MPIPRFIRRVALKFVLISQNHYDEMMIRAAKLVNEEFTKVKAEERTQKQP